MGAWTDNKPTNLVRSCSAGLERWELLCSRGRAAANQPFKNGNAFEQLKQSWNREAAQGVLP